MKISSNKKLALAVLIVLAAAPQADAGWLSDAWNNVKKSASQAVSGVKGAVVGAAKGVGNIVKETAKTGRDIAVGTGKMAAGVGQVALNTAMTPLTLATGVANYAMGKLNQAMGGKGSQDNFHLMKNNLRGIGQGVKNLGSGTAKIVAAPFKGAYGIAKGTLKAGGDITKGFYNFGSGTLKTGLFGAATLGAAGLKGVQTVGHGVKKVVNDNFDDAVDSAKKVGSSALNVVKGAGNVVKGAAGVALNASIGGAGAVLSTGLNLGNNLLQGKMDASAFDPLKNTALNIIGNAKDVGTGLKKMTGGAAGIVGHATAAVGNTVKGIGETGIEGAQALGRGVKTVVNDNFDDAVDSVKKVGGSALNVVKGAGNVVKGAAGAALNASIGGAGAVLSTGLNLGNNLLQGKMDASAFDPLKDTALNIIGNAKDVGTGLKKMTGGATGVVSNAVAAVGNTVKGAGETVLDTGKALTGKLTDKIQKQDAPTILETLTNATASAQPASRVKL